AASVGVFLLGKGDTGLFLVLISITGTGNGSALLHPAMQADIIDYDELQTGKRREAQYSSFWAIVPKFVAIPSAALPLALLAQLGYVPNQPQTPQVVFAMRALFLMPAVVNGVAWWIALRFPMTEAVHRKIREGIALHARGEPATDPILGVELHPVAQRRVDDETGWFLDHFSPSELLRAERGGARLLLRDVLVSLVLSLGVTLVSALWILQRLGDTVHKPGVGVTLVVVTAGLGLTGACFHALRVAPALRMRRRAIPRALIRAHLRPGSEGVAGQ
ncbi:MAG: MFS transporter, partial [Myxococcota bacterium]